MSNEKFVVVRVKYTGVQEHRVPLEVIRDGAMAEGMSVSEFCDTGVFRGLIYDQNYLIDRGTYYLEFDDAEFRSSENKGSQHVVGSWRDLMDDGAWFDEFSIE